MDSCLFLRQIIDMNLLRISTLTALSFMLYMAPSQAQIWNKVQKALEDKASKKVDDVLNGKKQTPVQSGSSTSAPQGRPALEQVYSFVPGNTIMFESDFKYDTKGRMPKKWKTNGAGSVAAVAGMPGNWLALSERTTYKIDSLLTLPGNFTIEFDLVTRSSEAADIGAMAIGFARDNSIKNHLTDAYNGNAITSTQLHFHNKDITNSSSDTKIYNTVEYPFASYSNALIQVAIAVEGENLSVYLDKVKVLDAKMFKPAAVKNFYLTSPFSYEQGAQVYFGNFVIRK